MLVGVVTQELATEHIHSVVHDILDAECCRDAFEHYKSRQRIRITITTIVSYESAREACDVRTRLEGTHTTLAQLDEQRLDLGILVLNVSKGIAVRNGDEEHLDADERVLDEETKVRDRPVLVGFDRTDPTKERHEGALPERKEDHGLDTQELGDRTEGLELLRDGQIEDHQEVQCNLHHHHHHRRRVSSLERERERAIERVRWPCTVIEMLSTIVTHR